MPKLTKSLIDRTDYEGHSYETKNGTRWKRHVVWDDLIPGFGVRVSHTGRKSFILKYRNEAGKTRQMTLGRFGVLTLKQARDAAREKLVEVAQGEDPLKRRQEKRDAETVSDLADAYVEKYARARKKTWKRDRRRLERHIKPRWGSRKAASITHRDVDELHRHIGIDKGHRVEANRTLALVQKMFNWARSNGYVSRTTPNPAGDVDKFPEKSRDRWVTPEEMPRLLDAIDAEDSPYVRAAYWLLILTGTRKSELKAMRWRDVDLERAELYIPDSKTNTSRTIPLSTPAVGLLEHLPQVTGNPFVLIGRLEGQGLVNLKDPWDRVRERCDLKDVRMHDLRRTAASWIAQLGYSEFVIRRFLGHSTKGVTGVYARMGSAEAIRRAVEDYGRRVADCQAGEGADVITLATVRGER